MVICSMCVNVVFQQFEFTINKTTTQSNDVFVFASAAKLLCSPFCIFLCLILYMFVIKI